ncbi:MAG: hypothetical protein ACK2T5_13455 [Anaerolineales bacterium]
MKSDYLKKLLRRENQSVVQGIVDAWRVPICIRDPEGHDLLFNPEFAQLSTSAKAALDQHPIEVNDEAVGQVLSAQPPDHLVRLLQLLITNEQEKKSLGSETLNLYREINLLYNLAEKLTIAPEVKPIAEMALENWLD